MLAEATTETFDRLDVTSKDDRGSEDARLVEAARAGDRSAMGQLHRRYAPMIHGILLARVPAGDADDLAQDVFVQALAKLPTLRDPRRFSSWLAMIARNASTDHHRRKRVTTELDDERVAASDGHAAERHVRALRVLAVIRKLPVAYREVLIMRLVEGMTGPEIAERAGLTPGSVRVNLHRGMKLLKQALEEVA